MNKTITIIKFIIGWPLVLVALFFIGRFFLGSTNILALFHSTNWLLLSLGILCFVVYFLFRSLFWQKLLQEKNIHYSFKETAFVWGIAELKRYIPGNIWSLLSRTTHYASKKHAAKDILTSILSEVEFSIVSCVVLTFFTVNFLVFGFTSFPLQIIAPYLIEAGIGIIVVIFIFHSALLNRIKIPYIQHFVPLFPPQSMTRLLAVMCAAFLFFGLGTYFSIASIVYLYPPHILSLAGFFAVSYLLGYASFITPMGLGVREAVITVGLSKYMPINTAVLSAIFSRIILILSELLFLSCIALWEKSKEKTKKIEVFILKHKYAILLLIVITLYIAYFTTASFLRYNNFFTGRFDLGNMDQTVWNTMRGRFFLLTNPDGTNIVSRLSFHADYMLALLAPFYYIWQDPKMLLLIQTVVLSLGALFVYRIGKNVFKNSYISFVFALLYLINPSVNNTNLYDFHAVTLATTFLLGAWYFLQKGKLLPVVIFLFLAGTTKEELWLTIGLIGLFILFFKKRYVWGFLISAVALSIFYYLFWHAIPAARGGSHFALSYYSDFGTTQGEVIKTILLSPWKIIQTLLSNGNPRFLLQIFSPLGFLSIFSPLFLFFAGGDFAISLLSQNAQLHNIAYQYTASLTPFIFLSSMYGFIFLASKIKRITSTTLATIFLCIGILCAYLFGPLPGGIRFNHAMFTEQLPYAKDIDTFLASIPRRYSVASSNNVGSHLSHRQRIYTIPNGLDSADIIVMLTNDQYAQPSLLAQKEMVLQLQQNPQYVQLFQLQDFSVFKKKNVPMALPRPQKGIFPLFKGN
ncbi:MAG TPA: DUF2079 domain-containing protein [Candidatus Eisenbacteria bacterium]|nr:DUF2079 domain-containing protein [Candidatus Eisenbacteria bacterium]